MLAALWLSAAVGVGWVPGTAPGPHAIATWQGPAPVGALLRLASQGIRHVSPYPLVADRAALGVYAAGLQVGLDTDFVYSTLAPGHPQMLASSGNVAVRAYLVAPRAPDAGAHLARARSYADFLITQAVTIDGAWMFPYDLDTKHYGSRWFSGLAQGSALSLFSELAAITGSLEYRRAADWTFRSFFRFRPDPYTHNDWVSDVDPDGYFWVEEYPRDTPDHVLNGHQFAIAGLHRYFMLTRNPAAGLLVRAGIATMSRYADDFRNRGWLSSKRLLDGRGEKVRLFSLKHHYHLIHIDLFLYGYAISGDPALKAAADAYLRDDAAFRRVADTAGSLTVRIEPPEASAAARWRRADASMTSSTTDYFDPSAWRASETVESGVVEGRYVVEFSEIGPCWDSPRPIDVAVSRHARATVVARYTPRYLECPFGPGERERLLARYLDEVSASRPSGESYLALGQLYQMDGDFGRAEEAYRASKAVGWGPLPDLYLARLFRLQARVDAALEHYDMAVAGCGRCHAWHAEKADLLLARGDRASAIAAFRESIGEPGNSVAHAYALYRWLQSNGLSDEAEALATATLNAANSLPEDARSLFLLGALQSRRRDWQGAVPFLEGAVRLAPRWINARHMLGSVYLRLGRVDAGLEQYERAAEVQSRSNDASEALRRVYDEAIGSAAGDVDAVDRICTRATVRLPVEQRPDACAARDPGRGGR